MDLAQIKKKRKYFFLVPEGGANYRVKIVMLFFDLESARGAKYRETVLAMREQKPRGYLSSDGVILIYCIIDNDFSALKQRYSSINMPGRIIGCVPRWFSLVPTDIRTYRRTDICTDGQTLL